MVMLIAFMYIIKKHDLQYEGSPQVQEKETGVKRCPRVCVYV